MFRPGPSKVVILRLLDEKPRHGYEIIKRSRSGLADVLAEPGNRLSDFDDARGSGLTRRPMPEEKRKEDLEITEEAGSTSRRNQR